MHIELHTGELGVVVAVHSLVAEILTDLIHPFEAAHDEAFEVELGGDTHIHILIKGIEMGDERTGRGTAGNHLQGGGLHLRVASFIEHLTDGPDHRGPLQEGVFHPIVHYQVNVALTVAQLGVVELIVGHTILVFHDRQGLQTLGEQGEFLGMDRDLSCLCTEHEALDADEVTDIHELLKYSII